MKNYFVTKLKVSQSQAINRAQLAGALSEHLFKQALNPKKTNIGKLSRTPKPKSNVINFEQAKKQTSTSNTLEFTREGAELIGFNHNGTSYLYGIVIDLKF